MVILLDVLKAAFAKQSHASQEASIQKRRNVQDTTNGKKKRKKTPRLLIMAQKAGNIKLLTEKNDRHLSSESTGHRKRVCLMETMNY